MSATTRAVRRPFGRIPALCSAQHRTATVPLRFARAGATFVTTRPTGTPGGEGEKAEEKETEEKEQRKSEEEKKKKEKDDPWLQLKPKPLPEDPDHPLNKIYTALKHSSETQDAQLAEHAKSITELKREIEMLKTHAAMLGASRDPAVKAARVESADPLA